MNTEHPATEREVESTPASLELLPGERSRVFEASRDTTADIAVITGTGRLMVLDKDDDSKGQIELAEGGRVQFPFEAGDHYMFYCYNFSQSPLELDIRLAQG